MVDATEKDLEQDAKESRDVARLEAELEKLRAASAERQAELEKLAADYAHALTHNQPHTPSFLERLRGLR